MTDIERENEARRHELVDADDVAQMKEITVKAINDCLLTIPIRASEAMPFQPTAAKAESAISSAVHEALAAAAAIPVRADATADRQKARRTPGATTLEDLSEETGIALVVIVDAASIVLDLEADDLDGSTAVSTVRTPARFDSEAEGIRKLATIAAAAYRALDPRAA